MKQLALFLVASTFLLGCASPPATVQSDPKTWTLRPGTFPPQTPEQEAELTARMAAHADALARKAITDPAPPYCRHVREVVREWGLPTGQMTFPDGSMELEWDDRRAGPTIAWPGLYTPGYPGGPGYQAPTWYVPTQRGTITRASFDSKGCLR